MFNRICKINQRNANIPYLNYFKKEIAARLSDRLLDIKRCFPNVAEIGVGELSHFIPESVGVKNLTVVDGSCVLLNNYNSPLITSKIIQDEEVLPFSENSFDAILSNCNMHWINDLPGILIQIRKSLKPDGLFLGCLLGGDSLFELRTCLQLANLERRGGLAPHISPMTNTRDIAGLLSRAGLTLTTVDMDEIQISFPSMWELLDDLKASRENGCLMNQAHLSRDSLLAASQIYQENYPGVGENDQVTGITATFQVIYMIGWKPGANVSQQSGSCAKCIILEFTFKKVQIFSALPDTV